MRSIGSTSTAIVIVSSASGPSRPRDSAGRRPEIAADADDNMVIGDEDAPHQIHVRPARGPARDLAPGVRRQLALAVDIAAHVAQRQAQAASSAE